jgi:HTH-type transcriptional regulator, quorum sensing regulator NprR
MNSIGSKLKEARVARGLTQQQLAEGVASKGFVSLVERDLLNPSLPKLRLLADRLGRPLAYFVQDVPDQDVDYLRKTAELAIRAHEPDRALKVIKETAGLPMTANERADLERLRGMALLALGKRAKALASLYAAAELAPPDDPELNASIFTELGAALGSGERFTASLETNLRALQWLDRAKHGDPDVRARLLTNLANDSSRLGDTPGAIEYLQRALAVATDAESLLRLANAHMAMGITSRAAGNLAQAINHCDRAISLHRRIGQPKVANQILHNLGDVYFAAGDLIQARRYQTDCLERAQQFNDTEAVAAATTELARYALREGRIDEVVSLARAGQAAAIRAEDHLYQATALALEGCALEKQGHARTADRLFRQAFRLLLERQAVAKMAELAAMYSELLGERGRHEAALEFMRMAYDRDFRRLDRWLSRKEQAPGS